MKPYFSDEDKQEQLIRVATEWLGTPFAGIKQGGTDCLNLVYQLLSVELGVPHRFALPQYAMENTMHSEQSLFLEYLNSQENLTFITKIEPPMIGDIAIFTIGRTTTVLYARAAGLVVSLSQLNDATWEKRLFEFWRVCPFYLE